MAEQPQSRWYALQVHPNHESAVASRLHNFGIESFLPKCKRRDKNAETAMPQVLFPGYLFCLLTLPTNPKLYMIPGVIRILGPPRKPTPIGDEEIRRLKILVEADIAAELHPHEQDEKEIRITPLATGPLAGLSVSVLHADQRCEVLVSFPTIGCSVLVTVPSEWLNSGPESTTIRPHL